jgi:hypothetical protein
MRLRFRSACGSLVVAVVAALAPVVGLTAPPAGAVTPSVVVTEVAPWGSGNAPYAADWFELTNTGAAAVNITGWKMDDNSDSFALAVALNGVTSIAPGQSVVFIEGTSTTAASFTSTWFGASPPGGFTIGTYSGSGVGLSTGGDAVNIFDSTGAAVTGVTFGVSDATSPFQSFDNSAGASGAISTLSAAGVNGAFLAPDGIEIGSPGTVTTDPNATTTTTNPGSTTTTTTTPGPNFQTWPGSATIQNASNYVFGGNLSGLDYEGSGSSAPGVLWGIRNGPGSLFRLLFDGTNWNPDPANGWANGKALHYPDGSGDPDSEGVTFVGDSSAGGMYVSTERDNNVSNVSHISVLRFDPSGSGTATSMNATNEWNLTPDLPPQGANLGAEAITWIDDSYLVSQNFFDEAKGHTYNPAEYPNHGSGLFFVGIEGNGVIYAYALDQTGSAYTRVATIASGFPAVMDLQFDRDLKDLWAVCDNTCNGRTTVLRIDPSTGKFGIALAFERPAGMPNFNNEGFAIAPATYCVDDFKPVFWADDTEDNGVAVRSGTLPCAAIATPPPTLAEFPIAVVPALVLAVIGAWFVRRRRRHLLPA